MIVPSGARSIAKVTSVQVFEANNNLTIRSTASRTTVAPNDGVKYQQEVENAASNTSHDAFRLFLKPNWFVCFWWLVGVLRGCEIAFLGAMFWLYHWLLNHPEHQVSTIDGLEFDLSYATLGLLNWTFCGLAVFQLFKLFQSVYYSLLAGELCFAGSVHRNQARHAVHPHRSDDHCWWSLRVSRAWMHKWIEPVFFIHGKYFDQYFLLRECIEVASQVYQAYQMSVYIPTRWINNLFVSMVFLNCLSTPIIHWVVPSTNLPLRRFLSVMCSAFLNFVNAVVIPFVIFMPYPSKYDMKWCLFDNEYLYDDVWYARALLENQQLFVTSFVDFCATWAPHWDQISCLNACEEFVCRRRSVIRIRRGPSHGLTPVAVKSSRAQSVQPLQSCPVVERRTTLKSSKPINLISFHSLWIIGVMVLVIHIAAQMPTSSSVCELQSAPWFTSESSCVVMKLNCYRRGIEGNQQEIHDILTQISPHSLFQIIFTHCPRLQVPPVISKFHQLTAVDMYNITLDAWPVESALCEANHPKMFYLAAYYLNVSGIPDGLLYDLPSLLNCVYLIEPNLTSLPERLNEHWPKVVEYFIHLAPLETFPSTLGKIQDPVLLNLVGNHIESIPKADFIGFLGNTSMQYLRLSGTHLQTLPEEFEGDLDHLVELDLEFTQVSEVPEYIRNWFWRKQSNQEFVQHSLYGSPFCNVTLPEPDDEDDDGDGDDEQRLYRRQVCRDYQGTAGLPEFFEIIEKQRHL